MHILHVLSSLDPRAGGPVVALVGLVEAQLKLGLKVSVLATFEESSDRSVIEHLHKMGTDVSIVGPVYGALKTHSDLSAAVQKSVSHADLVHIHAVWEEIQHQAATIARQLKRPYIFRTCGMLDPWQLKQGKLKKALYLRWRLRADLNGASALHFTSEEERQLVIPLRLKPKAIVEANGVQIPDLGHSGSPERFRERFGVSDAERILLFLSRIHPKKGLDLLIPAFGQASLANVKLVIAGPDENGHRAEIEKLIVEHDLQDRVLFTGLLQGTNKLDAFLSADLFVLPSYQENFGNAVVEALAAGTPVLISDQVNIYREISAAKVGGVIPTEVDALVRGLKLWLTDETLRQAAASRARPFVIENYNWEAIAQRWTQHYQELLATRS